MGQNTDFCQQTYGVEVEAQVLVEHVELSGSHRRLRRPTRQWTAARVRAETTERKTKHVKEPNVTSWFPKKNISVVSFSITFDI